MKLVVLPQLLLFSDAPIRWDVGNPEIASADRLKI